MKKAVIGICAIAVAAAIGTGAVFSSASTAEKKSVGAEKALEIALSDAGISKEQAKDKSSVFTKEHGKYVFDVDFDFENMEYDYKIAAKNGAIVNREVEVDNSKAEKTTTALHKETTTKNEPTSSAVSETTAPKTEPAAKVTEPTTSVPETSKPVLSTTAPSTTKAPATTKAQQSYRISSAEAKKIALSDAGISASKATFKKVKLEKDDGIYEYEIEFFANSKEYDYTINALTGKILEKDIDLAFEPTTKESTTQAPSTTAPKPTSGFISIGKAKAIALSHAGLSESEVTFKKVKLDRDDGVFEYEVEFQKGIFEYEYSINAKDGSIIDFEKEIDD